MGFTGRQVHFRDFVRNFVGFSGRRVTFYGAVREFVSLSGREISKMVCCESCKSVGQEIELIRTVQLRNADTHSFLTAAGHRQSYGADSVPHEFAHKFGSGHSFIASSVEESVADRFLTIFFIYCIL